MEDGIVDKADGIVRDFLQIIDLDTNEVLIEVGGTQQNKKFEEDKE